MDNEEKYIWNGENIEVKSKTKLEDDPGTGSNVVIRMFEFGVNPIAFQEYHPTLQDLFDSHKKGIERILWGDGLTPIDELAPRVVLSKDKKTYRIFVGAIPSKGNLLTEVPKTLSQIVHDGTRNKH